MSNLISFNPKLIIQNDNQSSKIVSQNEILFQSYINIKHNIIIRGYAELSDFVKNNITILLSSAVDRNPIALQIITDREFLIAMSMSNISLDREYINRFNRVYRAYVINPSKNVIYDEECAKLLYGIVLSLNKKMINILMSIGLPEENALWIIVNRYSSTDERRNIRRMVRSMQHMSTSIMTEQMVVNIFAKTFNDQFTNLFVAIMTDRFDAFYDDNEKYIYSTVSNALLDILNTMDIDEIKDIVVEYENELKKSGVRGRFSLESINSGDYRIICNAVEELKDMGLYID